MEKLKSIVKELLLAAVMIFILTNIISYLRSPELSSNVLPKIEVSLLDGTVYKPLKGKVLVLHFWATWCPTCKLEAPNIEAVSKEYEVLTVAVNSGSDAQLQVYMQERDLSFRVLNDKDGSWAKQFKVQAYPTTFIYDGNGELKFTEVGYTTTVGLLSRLKILQ